MPRHVFIFGKFPFTQSRVSEGAPGRWRHKVVFEENPARLFTDGRLTITLESESWAGSAHWEAVGMPFVQQGHVAHSSEGRMLRFWSHIWFDCRWVVP